MFPPDGSECAPKALPGPSNLKQRILWFAVSGADLRSSSRLGLCHGGQVLCSSPGVATVRRDASARQIRFNDLFTVRRAQTFASMAFLYNGSFMAVRSRKK
jgi:hypothetical protein